MTRREKVKLGRDLAFRVVLGLAILVGAFGVVPGENVAQGAQGTQGTQGSIGNGWRPLVQLPVGTSASLTELGNIKQSSGDWAVYTTSYYACGHCGFVD